MFKEYAKLNEGPMPGKPVFGPVYPRDFTPEDINLA